MTEFELPPLPDHPDSCIAKIWSRREEEAIREYATAARAPLIAANAALVADKSALLSRIAELEAQVSRLLARLEIKSEDDIHDGIFCRNATIQGIDKDRDTLRAELGRLRVENATLSESIALGPGAQAIKELSAELERCRAESEIHKRDVARYRRIRGGRCVQIGNGLRGDAVDAVVDADLEKIPNVYPVDSARAAHSTSETRRAEDSAPRAGGENEPK